MRNIQIIDSLLEDKEQKDLTLHCLGLGHFSSQLKPYLQMIFLRDGLVPLLQKHFSELKVNIFDPVFDSSEVE